MRQCPLRGPLAHGLGEQGDGRHQVQHPSAHAGGRLRNAQRRERLAGTAGHDELAAVAILEAGHHVVERGLLVGAQRERLTAQRQILRLAFGKIGPVEGPAGEVAKTEHGASGLQFGDGLDGVRPPAIAGVNDDAGGEGFPRRGGDERIQVRLADARAGRVALALNGAVAAVAFFGHQVDARVRAVEIHPFRRPLGPEPNLGEALAVDGVQKEVGFHQSLEQTPLVGLRISDGADVVQCLLESVAQSPPSLQKELSVYYRPQPLALLSSHAIRQHSPR